MADMLAPRNPTFATLFKYGPALASLRLLRGWNQTGQKFAGNPDIVKTFLIPNPQLVWILICTAYFLVSSQTLVHLSALPPIVAALSAGILLLASLSFKLAFTAEDAPEVVVGFSQRLHSMLPAQSLVLRAQIVFTILSGLAAYAVYRAKSGRTHKIASPGTAISPGPLFRPFKQTPSNNVYNSPLRYLRS